MQSVKPIVVVFVLCTLCSCSRQDDKRTSPQASDARGRAQVETNDELPKSNGKTRVEEVSANDRNFETSAQAKATAPTTKAMQSDSEIARMQLIDVIRQRPWDEKPILALADWLDSRDKVRADLIRKQLELAKLEYEDPRRRKLQQEVNHLLSENRERWTKPLGAIAERATVRFGLIDSLELEGATDEQIVLLKNIPELRELSLTSPKISEKSYAIIARLPNLDVLTIEADELSERCLLELEELPPWTVVQFYVDEIDWAKADAMNGRRIGRFQAMTPEEKTSAACRFLRHYSYSDSFGQPTVHARLSQAGIRDAEMQLLAGLPNLETVYISESDITSKGVSHLAGLTKIKSLGLWDTKVESIASLSGLINLEKLGIYPEFDTTMGDSGLESLDKFTKLEDLYLSDEEISDVTVQKLAPLTNLRKLNLTVGSLKQEDSLAALAGLKKLEQLSFHGATLSDDALKHLSEMKKLHTLNINVELGNGDGFKHLADLDSLSDLHLSGKGVNDNAIIHLKSLTGLKSIMAQGSAITKPGAEEFAAHLPHVTIILDEHVVKSPRKTYRFSRMRFNDTVSLLLPDDWTGDEREPEDPIWMKEDGWERIGGWSGEHVGPAAIQMYVETEGDSAQKALMASVNNNSHLNPVVVEKDVQALRGSEDTASCIYQNDSEKHLVSAAKVAGGFVVLDCEAPPSRFDEFETLFKAIARSVRIGDDPKSHGEQTIEVPADKVMPKRSK